MPPIFKALATITVWILFVLGCFGIAANLIMGTVTGEYFNPDAVPSVGTALSGGTGIVSLALSVVCMKLRQMLE